jgi:DNA-binding CsgD family transcriptional regulator
VHEREPALAAIEHTLRSASAGRGGALFAIGAPGLGKTRLVRSVADLAATDFSIGSARGDALQASRSLSLVGELVRSLAATTGREAPALVHGRLKPEAAAARTVRFFVESAHAPVLLLVDDIHMADMASLEVVASVARHAMSLPMAIVATLRESPRNASAAALALAAEDVAELVELKPLNLPETASLLRERSRRRWRASEIRGVWELCAGNPLLVEQIALGLVPINGAIDPDAAAVQRISRRVLVARFVGAAGPERAYAETASVFGTRFRISAVAEVARLDEARADNALRTLADNDVIRANGPGWARFGQPLLRRLIYEDIPRPLRSRLHAAALRRLVALGAEIEESAMHALESHQFGDRDAVSVLEQAGRHAITGGELDTGRQILETAIRLAGKAASPDLLLMHAEALVSGGRTDDAIKAVRQILRSPGSPATARVRAQRLLGRCFLAAGRRQEAVLAVQAAGNEANRIGGTELLEALMDLSEILWLTQGAAPAAEVLDHAKAVVESLAPAAAPRVRVASAFLRLVEGDDGELQSAEAALAMDESDPYGSWPLVITGWPILPTYIQMMTMTEQFQKAELAFKTGSAQGQGFPLSGRVALEMGDSYRRWGELAAARELAHSARRAAEREAFLLPWVAVLEAELNLDLGLLDEAEKACTEAGEIRGGALPPLLALRLGGARAKLLAGRGLIGEACTLYEQLHELARTSNFREPCAAPWARDAIEAFLAAGRRKDAEDVINWVKAAAEKLPCAWPRLVVTAGAADLAERDGDDETARALFGQALDIQAMLEMPVEKCRTWLAYGAFLRRNGEPRAARPQLARALRLAEQVGAAWLEAQVREELHAAGGRRRQQLGRQELSTQEARAVRLASDGLTNVQIGRLLRISPKTVESHLRSAYRKLNVRSRRDLMVLGGREREAAAPARPRSLKIREAPEANELPRG